jgi:Predicted DNA alkylation repair enzyme
VVESVETLVKTATSTSSQLEREIIGRLARLTSRRTNDIRSVRRDFSKQISNLSGAAVISLALHLLKNEQVPRFFSYELVHHHKHALASLNSRNTVSLGQGIDSWDAVDTFACYLSGPAWRENQIPDALVEKWTQSKDRWWRRAAVVTTVPLNNIARGGKGEAARTLKICRLVINDRDDMVVKALSWALRELAKRDRPAVQAFIEANVEGLAPRVLREVRNKLTTGLKNPTLRA